MDATERHVNAHLLATFAELPVYEPDGNVPPDFLLRGRIAIEARRLNQHDESAGQPRGLEETAIPFWATLRGILKELGPPVHHGSWLVSCSFGRPLPTRAIVRKTIRAALQEFAAQTAPSSTQIRVDRVTLRLERCSKKHPFMFVPGASVDHNSGGFVVSELVRNIHICIDQKTRKIAHLRQRYPTWWLFLVDEIAYGHLDSEDISQLRGALQPRSEPWSRIVLLDPEDPLKAVEL